jgi:hypothetical protein
MEKIIVKMRFDLEGEKTSIPAYMGDNDAVVNLTPKDVEGSLLVDSDDVGMVTIKTKNFGVLKAHSIDLDYIRTDIEALDSDDKEFIFSMIEDYASFYSMAKELKTKENKNYIMYEQFANEKLGIIKDKLNRI